MKNLVFVKPQKDWTISINYQDGKLEYEIWNRKDNDLLLYQIVTPVTEQEARLTAIAFCKFYGINRDIYLVNAIRRYHRNGVMEVYRLF